MDTALIKQTVEMDGLKIRREYPSDEKRMDFPQEKLNRNISALNEKGSLVWTIQVAPHGGENEDKASLAVPLTFNRKWEACSR